MDFQMAQAEAIGRITLGGAVSAWVAFATLSGNITGGGPVKRTEKRLLEAKGWRPFSFKLGDAYYSYRRFEPIAFVISSIATLTERGMEAHKEGKALDEGEFISILFETAGFVLDSTFWRGISEFNEALAGKNKDVLANMIAGRVAFPFIRDINRLFFDPVIRKPKGTLETIKSRLPGISTEVAPFVTAAGEIRTVEESGGFIGRIFPFKVSRIRGDIAVVVDELLKFGISVPETGKNYTPFQVEGGAGLGSIELTEMERSRVDIEAGKRIFSALHAYITSEEYQDDLISEADKMKHMKQLIAGIRKGVLLKTVFFERIRGKLRDR